MKRFGTCFLLLKLLNQIETQVLEQFFFENGSRLSMGHWVTQTDSARGSSQHPIFNGKFVK